MSEIIDYIEEIDISSLTMSKLIGQIQDSFGSCHLGNYLNTGFYLLNNLPINYTISSIHYGHKCLKVQISRPSGPFMSDIVETTYILDNGSKYTDNRRALYYTILKCILQAYTETPWIAQND